MFLEETPDPIAGNENTQVQGCTDSNVPTMRLDDTRFLGSFHDSLQTKHIETNPNTSRFC